MMRHTLSALSLSLLAVAGPAQTVEDDGGPLSEAEAAAVRTWVSEFTRIDDSLIAIREPGITPADEDRPAVIALLEETASNRAPEVADSEAQAALRAMESYIHSRVSVEIWEMETFPSLSATNDARHQWFVENRAEMERQHRETVDSYVELRDHTDVVRTMLETDFQGDSEVIAFVRDLFRDPRRSPSESGQGGEP